MCYTLNMLQYISQNRMNGAWLRLFCMRAEEKNDIHPRVKDNCTQLNDVSRGIKIILYTKIDIYAFKKLVKVLKSKGFLAAKGIWLLFSTI